MSKSAEFEGNSAVPAVDSGNGGQQSMVRTLSNSCELVAQHLQPLTIGQLGKLRLQQKGVPYVRITLSVTSICSFRRDS